MMNPSRKYKGPTFVVVSPEAAKQSPYPYVHVNDDGTVRELRSDERTFLERPFSPGDGGRPAIKSSYQSKNGWGTVRGFCRRSLIPEWLEILPADAPEAGLERKNNPTEPESQTEGSSAALEEKNQTPPAKTE